MAKNEAYSQLTASGSLGADFTSDTINTERNDLIGIQIVYSGGGSPTGTFILQASIDGSTWSTVTGSSVAITTDGNTLYTITDICYRYLRVNYTRTSGTATINIYLYKREV